MSEAENATIGRAAARVGNYRWVIVGLLFAATVINYVDRQMLGVLKPTLSTELFAAYRDRTPEAVFGNSIYLYREE